MKVATALVALTTLAGCAPGPRGAPSPYTYINGDPHETPRVFRSPDAWNDARAWLVEARSELPQKPYVARVRLGVIDPRTQRVVQLRGAVAVNPERAARLVLVGPGGATALDAWVTPDRYRIEIPALNLTRRGGRDVESDPQATLGLPVGFLRWWFLAPLRGHIIDAEEVSDNDHVGTELRLHEPDATVELWHDKQRITAMRRASGHVEAVEWRSTNLAPAANIAALYENMDVGLRVEVVIEEVMPNEPEPAAFLDPDLDGE